MSNEPQDSPEETAATPAASEGAQGTPAPPQLRDARGRLSWVTLALIPLILMLAFVAHLPLKRSAGAMSFPYQLDREEGFLLYQAMEAAQSRTIYPAIADYPFVVGNYPPVYPFLYGGLLHFARPSLEIGRAIVLISVMVILATLTNLILRETGRVLPAMLAMMLFLANYDVNNWIAFARVDFPAIAFGLLGLMAITSPMRRLGFVLGVLFFVTAFYTKQTQLIAPGAALAGMLWRREWTRAGLFCVCMFFVTAGIFALMNVVTNGEFFRHTIVYNMNVMDWGVLKIWIRHLYFWGFWKYLALVALAAVLPVLRGNTNEPRARTALPESIAFVVLSALSIYSIAKAGSAPNYLLEFQAATSLCIGMAFGFIANRLPLMEGARAKFARGMVIAAMLLLLVQACDLLVGLPGRLSREGKTTWGMRIAKSLVFDPAPGPERAEAGALVELELVDEPGEILAEEPIFTIRTGREVLYQPFIMAQLAKEGRWQPDVFVADLDAVRFSVIVANQNFFREDDALVSGFTPEMLAAIRRRYELYRQIGGYYLYVPRGSTKQPEAVNIAQRINLHPIRITVRSAINS